MTPTDLDSTANSLECSSQAKSIKCFEKLPTCQEMATSALADSCASIDGNSQSGPNDLENQKTLYAARLAVCELYESQVPIPTGCEHFVPSKENSDKQGHVTNFGGDETRKMKVGYPIYEDYTERDLGACLVGLQTDGRSWTSYSNARQNAVTLCQAARVGVEKSEILNIYRIMTDSTLDNLELSQKLNDNLREALKDHHDGRENMVQFWHDLHESGTAELSRVREAWNAIMEDMQKIAANHTDSLIEKAERAGARIDNFKDQVEGANTALDQMTDHQKALVASASAQLEILQQQTVYSVEMVAQHAIQLAYNLTGNLEQSAKMGSILSNGMQELGMMNTALNQQAVGILSVLNLSQSTLEEIHEKYLHLNSSIDESLKSMSHLKKLIDGVSKSVAAITGLFSTVGYIPWLAIILVVLLRILALPNGLPLFHAFAGVVRYVVAHMGCYILMLLAILMIAYHLIFVETLWDLTQRWMEGGVSRLEGAGLVSGATLLVFLLSSLAIRCFRGGSVDEVEDEDEDVDEKPTNPKRGRFWFNDPKKYEHKKWLV